MHTHPKPSSPFLKWVGGKSRLLPFLLPRLPAGRRLLEPFVGAAAVFLAADYPHYVINDVNADLVAVWRCLQKHPQQFIAGAKSFFTPANLSQAAFLRIRDEFNASTSALERAVRLPYLNRFGFNGLYRVNQSGRYNVSFGRPARVPTFPEASMRAAAAKLARVNVLQGSFEAVMEMARAGDVLYLDPPYCPTTNGKSFVGYAKQGFGLQDHQRLVDFAQAASQRGAHVLVSNHDTPDTRRLYAGWAVHEVTVRRSVSAASSHRGIARELLAELVSQHP